MADEVTSTETSAAETVTANDAPAAEAVVDQGAAEGDETALGAADTEAADAGEAEGEAAQPEIPEAYELTFSEGVTADAATIEEATPLLKELNLSNEQAQKFVPIIEAHTERAIKARDAQIDQFITEQRKGWLDAAKSDEQIGGKNWDATIVDAAKALDRFGAVKGSEFRGLLDQTGLGNHPEMIRMFAAIGKAISEDTDFPRASGANAPAQSREEILYPSMTKKD